MFDNLLPLQVFVRIYVISFYYYLHLFGLMFRSIRIKFFFIKLSALTCKSRKQIIAYSCCVCL